MCVLLRATGTFTSCVRNLDRQFWSRYEMLKGAFSICVRPGFIYKHVQHTGTATACARYRRIYYSSLECIPIRSGVCLCSARAARTTNAAGEFARPHAHRKRCKQSPRPDLPNLEQPRSSRADWMQTWKPLWGHPSNSDQNALLITLTHCALRAHPRVAPWRVLHSTDRRVFFLCLPPSANLTLYCKNAPASLMQLASSTQQLNCSQQVWKFYFSQITTYEYRLEHRL